MALPQNIDGFIGAYIRAFNDRDFDFIESLFASQATLEDPVGSTLIQGRANIRAFYDQYRYQTSYLHYSGDCRKARSAIAFAFIACIGTGADMRVVHITDSFRFDENSLILEMRAFWGETDVSGIASGTALAPKSLLPLAGRVALVTGGDTPLGRACALALVQYGARLGIAGILECACQSVAEEVGVAGGQAFVSGAGGPETLERMGEHFGRLDHIVNIAASVELTELGNWAELVATTGEYGSVVDIRSETDAGTALASRIGNRAHRVRHNIVMIDLDKSTRRASRISLNEIANAAILLLLPEASVISGQSIRIS